MSEPLEMILARLDGVVQQNGHFMARCPAHADVNPSLCVKLSNTGNVVLTCYAGCDFTDICRALDLHPSALFARTQPPPLPPPKRVVATTRYRIRDRTGNLVATHTRVDYNDGTKDTPWPIGTKPKELPLYGIHERRDDHTTAIVVEGEKARDALDPLTPHHILVVGTVCGAGATPSLDTLSDLAGLVVILWPDNDDPGRRHMERIAALLASAPQWIEWPDAPPKGDAADWVATGRSWDDLVSSGFLSSYQRIEEPEQTNETPPAGQIRFRLASAVVATEDAEMSWVVEPWLPSGGILKIDGAPKSAGKTTFVLAMIAAVTSGTDFLGRSTRPGRVVMLTEQGASSFREAIVNAGLEASEDFHIATFVDFAGMDWATVCSQTFAYAQSIGAVLIVVDTLPACSRVRGDDENSAGAAMGALEPVQVGVDQTGIGAALIFHDKKSGGEVGHSGRGSSAYAGAVDVIVQLSRPGGNMPPNVRKLSALSRYQATPGELYVEYVDGGYRSLGTDDDVQAASARRQIVEVLPREPSQAMPVDDRKDNRIVVEPGIRSALAAAGVKISRYTLDNVLAEGMKTGAIGRSGTGVRHAAYRYWLDDPDAPLVSSVRSSAIPEERSEGNQFVSSDRVSATEESISPGHPDWVWSQPVLDETDNP